MRISAVFCGRQIFAGMSRNRKRIKVKIVLFDIIIDFIYLVKFFLKIILFDPANQATNSQAIFADRKGRKMPLLHKIGPETTTASFLLQLSNGKTRIGLLVQSEFKVNICINGQSFLQTLAYKRHS